MTSGGPQRRRPLGEDDVSEALDGFPTTGDVEVRGGVAVARCLDVTPQCAGDASALPPTLLRRPRASSARQARVIASDAGERCVRVRILGTLLVAMGTVLATGCGSIGPSFDPLPLDGAPADQASEADGPIPSDSGTPDTPMDAFVGVDASGDSPIDVLGESSADAGADSTVDTSLPSIDSAADSDDDSGDAVSTVPDSAPQDSATVADSAPSSDSSDAPDTPASFTVGGTITGLAAGASLVLVDNGGACTFDCLPGSTCKNTCAGGDCAFDCDPTMSTCDDVCQGGICTGP